MKWVIRGPSFDRLDPGEIKSVSAADRGVLLGDGVFETMRTYGGAVFALQKHMDRLRQSLRHARMSTEVVAEVEHRLPAAVGKLSSGELYVRVTICRGVFERGPRIRQTTPTTVLIHLDPMQEQSAGRPSTAITLPCPLANTSLRQIKSTSMLGYLLALDEASNRGADEAILYDSDGTLVEGATSNLFVLLDGTWRTPPLSRNILPGVTRSIVLELSQQLQDPVMEVDIHHSDLARAEEVFLTSTLRQIAPVTAIDGTRSKLSPESPRTQRFATAFQEVTSAGGSASGSASG